MPRTGAPPSSSPARANVCRSHAFSRRRPLPWLSWNGQPRWIRPRWPIGSGKGAEGPGSGESGDIGGAGGRSQGADHMLYVGLLVTLIAVLLIARRAVPAATDKANLGWMSEQWLAEHRAASRSN